MKRIVVWLLNFCMLYFCMGCKLCDDKLCDNEKIHLVECIQLNSARFAPEEFGEEKLETLLDYLYSTEKIISEQEIDESALLHDVVTIYYEDGERDMFCFHKIDDIWYMRQEDGTVIQDAAFISEYITHVENSGSISTVLSIPEKDLLTALVPDGKLDERYVFTRKLQERLSQGMEKTEAEKSVREAMISEYLLYQYALQNGYEVDDTSAELMDQLTELCKTAENLQEAEQELEKVGISLEEYLEMQENLLVCDAAKQVIYEEKYHAYRHGDTVIGERDCSDFTEYWNTFLLEVVGSEMEKFDLTEYEKVLDEAAAFANEILDNTVTVYLHNDNQFVVRAAISAYEQERNSVIGTELESKWPEISWNLVDKSYLSDEEFQVMLLQELQNGGGPDLILSENDGAWDVNAMMENGYLLDLSDFAGGEPDAEYLVGTLEAGQVSGIQYMWPLAVETPVFFGYKQTLEEVGLCEDFHNMQEFLEKAIEAQEITGKAVFENDNILEWLLYYGEEENEGDFNKRKELLGNIEVVDTATTEMDVYGSFQALEAGTCLLGACGTYDPARMFMNMTQMDQNDLVIFSVPDWSGETKAIIPRAIGVNTNSKHPQLALAALQAFCTAKEIAFFWDDMPAQISVGWENMAGVYWYSVSESPYLDYAESMGSFSRSGSVAEMYLENVQQKVTDAVYPVKYKSLESVTLPEVEPKVLTIMYKGTYLGEEDPVGKWLNHVATDYSDEDLYIEIIDVYRPSLVFAEQYAELEEFGVAPDMVIISNSELANLSKNEEFADLSLLNTQYREQIEEILAINGEFPVFNGESTLIPLAIRGYGIWYDKKVFSDWEIDVDTILYDEHDMRKLLEEIAIRTESASCISIMGDTEQFAVGILSGMIDDSQGLFVLQNDGTWKIDRIIWENAVQTLQSLIAEFQMEDLSRRETISAFQNKEIILSLGSSELIRQTGPNEVDSIPENVSFIPTSDYVSGISACFSKKSGQNELALQFILEALQHESYIEFAMAEGFLPVVSSAYQEGSVLEEIDKSWLQNLTFLPIQKNSKSMKELWRELWDSANTAEMLSAEYYPFPLN